MHDHMKIVGAIDALVGLLKGMNIPDYSTTDGQNIPNERPKKKKRRKNQEVSSNNEGTDENQDLEAAEIEVDKQEKFTIVNKQEDEEPSIEINEAPLEEVDMDEEPDEQVEGESNSIAQINTSYNHLPTPQEPVSNSRGKSSKYFSKEHLQTQGQGTNSNRHQTSFRKIGKERNFDKIHIH